MLTKLDEARFLGICAHCLPDELQGYCHNLLLAIVNQRVLSILNEHSNRFTVEAVGFLGEQGVPRPR
jgi:hypothetical protein